MRIVVVSKKDLSVVFGKGSDIHLEFYNTTKLSSLISDEPTLFYVDMALWDSTGGKRAISSLIKKQAVRVGVLDTANSIEDPAAFFHMGCVDFINREVLSERIPAARYRKVLDFIPFTQKELAVSETKFYSSKGWSNIKNGQEYIFGLMFIEIDEITSLINDLGSSVCNRLSLDLQQYLNDFIGIWDGYTWIWMDYGGVILFPYNGITCHSLVASMELIMNQELNTFSKVKRDVTFRIALHLGKTVFYKRGKTGEIISDSINSLFHLGHHFVKPATLHLTETMKPFIPRTLNDFFVSAGEFENREILKLKNRL